MIDITDLSFGYGSGTLFNGLNIKLTRGNIYGLLGKNGAGKTTLLKIMCGLLFPQQGGCNVHSRPADKRFPVVLRDIFFVPEDFEMPSVTVQRYYSLYAPFYPDFNYDLFKQYLAAFEIPFETGTIPQLSFGQRKKLLVAFGLAAQTPVLILDEPTNGLDIPSKGVMRTLLAAAQDTDRMVIISTHQIRDMEDIIDPVILLDEGRIIFNDSLESISEHLAFKIVQNPDEEQNILYQQKVPGGYSVITAREGDEKTRVDVETFFNATISDTEKIMHYCSTVQDVK